MFEVLFEERFYNKTSHHTGFYSIIPIRIMASSPTLRSLAFGGLGSLVERLPRSASSQSALHVRVDNRQTIYVAGINPSET